MRRLATRFWIDAYLMRLQGQNIPAFVVTHGDDVAGAVLVKSNTLDGFAVVHQRSFDLMSGERMWTELCSGPESAVDIAITRQQNFDPDLWVIEVEDKSGRHLLDEFGLE